MGEVSGSRQQKKSQKETLLFLFLLLTCPRSPPPPPPTSPSLLVPYCMVAVLTPPTAEMLTMTPLLCLFMAGSTACVTNIGPSEFVWKQRRMSYTTNTTKMMSSQYHCTHHTSLHSILRS